MGKAKKNKISRDTVPEGFRVSLAVVDLIPVVFFGLSALRIGQLFSSVLFLIGAAVCLVSGVVKVLWKLIAALYQKNAWPMFVQMRLFMPLGFLAMLAALVVGRANINARAILAGLLSIPSCIFFALGLLGMVLMTVFAFRLDSSDPKANWLEQAVNGVAQACFFIGLLLL